MKDTIIEYIRDKNHEPHGCLVGRLIEDSVKIGVSVCRNELECFNKNKGRMIAEGRIAANRNSAWRKDDLHVILSKPISNFKTRCKRYFKTDKIEVVGV